MSCQIIFSCKRISESICEHLSSDRAYNQYRTNSRQRPSQLFHCLFSSSWSTCMGRGVGGWGHRTFNVNFLPQMSNKSSKLGPSNSITKALYFPQGPDKYILETPEFIYLVPTPKKHHLFITKGSPFQGLKIGTFLVPK